MADQIPQAGSEVPQKCKRGFASMPLEKLRAIASKGGRSPGVNRPFRNKDLAHRAGRLGGIASRGGQGKLPELGLVKE